MSGSPLQAALTVARRVAEEMRCEVGQEVGYRVRFEERTSRRTRIVYLTGTFPTQLLDLHGNPLMYLQPSC